MSGRHPLLFRFRFLLCEVGTIIILVRVVARPRRSADIWPSPRPLPASLFPPRAPSMHAFCCTCALGRRRGEDWGGGWEGPGLGRTRGGVRLMLG